METFIVKSKNITKKDTQLVGGKTSNLGEMINKVKVPVPDFFAITSYAYTYFLKQTGIDDYIKTQINSLKKNDLKNLQKIGRNIRIKIKKTEMPNELKESIKKEYLTFSKQYKKKEILVAVRSSATAEDLDDASFAGQQDTYLNIKGEKDLIESVRNCFASLFTDRAINYRNDKGFNHLKVMLSVTVQKMINSLSSGVIFTIDPDSGFKNVMIITGSWGLGEYIVQGKVTPDEYIYFKPTEKIIQKKLGSKKIKLIKLKNKGNIEKKTTLKEQQNFVLNDKQLLELAKFCMKIEKHYKKPMDIEWALDNDTKKLAIVQARAETVQSNKDLQTIQHFKLNQKSKILVTGKSVGRKITTGKVRIINSVKDIHDFKKGEILVTTMTDPDWEPIMKIARAIITNSGGSTSHAAIISRELGIPAIVGSVNGTKILKTGQLVTVDCTKNQGNVWKNKLDYSIKKIKVNKIPKTKTKISVNLGDPGTAFDVAQLPVDGVGLTRMEFILSSYVREHPLYMIKQKRQDEFVNKLSEGIARIAAAFYPREVILRTSDFKTNEYRNLKGGKEFEPLEENPMIGWRGVSRYINPNFTPAFELELKAIKKVREEFELTNLSLLIPFCRTINEGKQLFKLLNKNGIKRGLKGQKIYLMAEIPSNIILFEEFSKMFDGFSIGSNDLTQLTLGIDRDSTLLIDSFNEKDPAVMSLIKELIKKSRKNKKYVGICGNAPSEHKSYAKKLVEFGITAISVTSDVVLETKLKVAKIEKEL